MNSIPIPDPMLVTSSSLKILRIFPRIWCPDMAPWRSWILVFFYSSRWTLVEFFIWTLGFFSYGNFYWTIYSRIAFLSFSLFFLGLLVARLELPYWASNFVTFFSCGTYSFCSTFREIFFSYFTIFFLNCYQMCLRPSYFKLSRIHFFSPICSILSILFLFHGYNSSLIFWGYIFN